MALADFIDANLDGLIDDWVDYAKKINQASAPLTAEQLRDSARALMLGIAADMREAQTEAQQKNKSLGNRPEPDSTFNGIAYGHADDRLGHGYDLNALVAEFRALRASVLRRWQASGSLNAEAFEEMIRFNEAIDQMLAESVRQYAERSERIRDLFAGVLAHDMRSPAGSILNSAVVLLHDEQLSNQSVKAGKNIQRSALQLRRLIDDLFAFTRTRLGDTLPITSTPQNLEHICQEAADQVRTACPQADITVDLTGDLEGIWDGARISQLLVNLMTNAVVHAKGPVRLQTSGNKTEITLKVWNGGTPIPPSALPTLFDPLTRVSPSLERNRSSGMGLGLYICRCIAQTHNGAIAVQSDVNGTVFTVTMPRILVL